MNFLVARQQGLSRNSVKTLSNLGKSNIHHNFDVNYFENCDDERNNKR